MLASCPACIAGDAKKSLCSYSALKVRDGMKEVLATVHLYHYPNASNVLAPGVKPIEPNAQKRDERASRTLQ